MKKKKLSMLSLRKWKISNLSLLHNAVGGTDTTGTDGVPSDNESNNDIDCPNTHDCGSQIITDCITNGGTTKSQLITEYKSCMCNDPGLGN